MSTGNNYIPVENVLFDAAQELSDPEYRKAGGRPFYLSAAQRGMSKMFKDTMTDERLWNSDILSNLILHLPNGLEEIDAVYLYNGDHCNVSLSQKVYIKPGMYRLGGSGYIAGDKWTNFPDPLQYDHGWGPWNGWSCQPPPSVFFAGRHDGVLFLSDSCSQFAKIAIVYQGIGVDCFGEDFRIPYWMRDAITDYVVMRAAQRMRRQDPQYLTQIIREKKAEMDNPGGSWLTAMAYAKRMDRKTRDDTRVYLETFGGRM